MKSAQAALKAHQARAREVRKAVVVAASALSQALALGMLPAPYDKYAMLCLSLAAVYGVYKVPNGDKAVAE